MTILAAAASDYATEFTTHQPPGFIQTALTILGALLVLATIFLPFVIWSIMNTLRRIEKHNKLAAEQMIALLSRLPARRP